MISCEEATTICNKKQYNEASFVERLKFRFHILICRACSAFTKKNEKLTTLFEKADLHSLSENEKERIKEQLQNKF